MAFVPPVPDVKIKLVDLLKKNIWFSGYLSRPVKSPFHNNFTNCTWAEHYVVLDGGCLYIFKNGRESEPSLALSLFGYSEVRKYNTDDFKTDEYVFEVKTVQPKMKNYTFAIPSLREYKEWMQHFKSALDAANGRSVSCSNFRSVKSLAAAAPPKRKPMTAPPSAPAGAPPTTTGTRTKVVDAAPLGSIVQAATPARSSEPSEEYAVYSGSTKWDEMFWPGEKLGGKNKDVAITEILMRINKEGVYLIKEKSQGEYTLCVWINNSKKKFKVLNTDEQWYLEEHNKFPNVEHVIYHYEKYDLPNNRGAKLTRPYTFKT